MIKEIAIIGGCGHVGFPLGLAMASRGFHVKLIDINEQVIENRNLYNDLSETFKKLNEDIFIYPRIKINVKFEQLDLIKDLNINFDKIKILMLDIPVNSYDEDNPNINFYVNKATSFFKNKKNLEHFFLSNYYHKEQLSLDIINSFNNFSASFNLIITSPISTPIRISIVSLNSPINNLEFNKFSIIII